MGIDRVGRRGAPRRRGGTCLEPRRNFAKGCWRWTIFTCRRRRLGDLAALVLWVP